MTTGTISPETQDLVLAPETYAYTQAANNGSIRVHVGSTAVPLSGQEKPVRFDAASESFVRCGQNEAVQKNARAAEGDYLILVNPAVDGKFPEPDGARTPPRLKSGRRVNMAGPCSVALWPGQRAQHIKGHNLRSNQYLIVRVYNDEEARANWDNAIFKRVAKIVAVDPNKNKTAETNSQTSGAQNSTENNGGSHGTGAQANQTSVVTQSTESLNLSMGALHIIRGTEVSFYIPPTGVEVVPDPNGNYVRDAVTLEQLEYCILVDENGEKRFEKGPAVIFPEPTEQFITNNNARKFRAFELNAIQGLHIKVISDYEDGNKKYSTGEELFITGKDASIYYPRPEHAIIRYGDQERHYATAIPEGEARYVMNRITGKIEQVRGPKMLLPDPRTEVIVRRVLSQKQVGLWYPGNAEALQYNASLEESLSDIGTSHANFVDDSAFRSRSLSAKGAGFSGYSGVSGFSGYTGLEGEALGAAPREKAGSAHVADALNRGISYTKPRTITLDTKYEGVPAINIWTGYAVLVVDKQGNRRVEQGPCSVLLNYDETLEVLEMSTGKPKNTDRLERTVYLRVTNNKVSDNIEVETSDHVKVAVKISMRVNFEGDPKKWFSAENYVKLLTDHVRSVLKGAIKKYKVEEFYASYVDVIRNVILGTSEGDDGRPGMAFKDNGMVVTDVEVLDCTIGDSRIKGLLEQAQHDVVKTNIEMNTAQRQLEVTEELQEIERRKASAQAETKEHQRNLDTEAVGQELKVALAKLSSEIQQAAERKKKTEADEAIQDVQTQKRLARERAEADQEEALAVAEQTRELEKVAAEVEAVCKKFEAGKGSFAEAILALSRDEIIVKVAEATKVQRLIGGDSVVDAIRSILKGTPLEKIAERLGSGYPGLTENGRLVENTRS